MQTTDPEIAARLRSLALDYRAAHLRWQRVVLAGRHLADEAAIMALEGGGLDRAAKRMWDSRRRLDAAILARGAVVLVTDGKLFVAVSPIEVDELDEHAFDARQVIDLDAERLAALKPPPKPEPSRLMAIARGMLDSLGEQEVCDRLLLTGRYERPGA